MVKLIDMEAVIRHFVQDAVNIYSREDMHKDDEAISAIRDTRFANRHEVIRRWLVEYGVFQGFKTSQRDDVTKAVLKWADEHSAHESIDSLNALTEAHRELEQSCCLAFKKTRAFTSLASKALWLCYPNDVPIFDNLAQRALWMICKLEDAGKWHTKENESKYTAYATAWKELYKRYDSVLNSLSIQPCQYRVRIFDKILLGLGEGSYQFRQ